MAEGDSVDAAGEGRTSVARETGWAAVVRRELQRMAARRIALALELVLPLVGLTVVLALFWQAAPRDLPIVVVDLDRSALSRQLVRMVDATPGLRVAVVTGHPEEASDLVLRGRAYGYVVVPANLERDVRRGQAAPVIAYTNAALLLPGSIVRRDVRAAVGALSAGLELRTRVARGATPTQARAQLEPVRVEAHGLFNPQLNYVHFLVVALYPTLLQMFVLLAVVQAVGSELEEGTAGEWLRIAGGSTAGALLGKLLPHLVAFATLGFCMRAVVFTWAGTPMRGSGLLLGAGSLVFVVACGSMGLLFVAVTANLRLATSAAAFYAGPAFAFAGVTFPTAGMPLLGRLWGELLPLTHFVRLLVDQGLRGSAPAASFRHLLALLAFSALAAGPAWWRMRTLQRDPRTWGRQ